MNLGRHYFRLWRKKAFFAIVDTHRNCMLERLKEIMLEEMADM